MVSQFPVPFMSEKGPDMSQARAPRPVVAPSRAPVHSRPSATIMPLPLTGRRIGIRQLVAAVLEYDALRYWMRGGYQLTQRDVREIADRLGRSEWPMLQILTADAEAARLLIPQLAARLACTEPEADARRNHIYRTVTTLVQQRLGWLPS